MIHVDSVVKCQNKALSDYDAWMITMHDESGPLLKCFAYGGVARLCAKQGDMRSMRRTLMRCMIEAERDFSYRKYGDEFRLLCGSSRGSDVHLRLFAEVAPLLTGMPQGWHLQN